MATRLRRNNDQRSSGPGGAAVHDIAAIDTRALTAGTPAVRNGRLISMPLPDPPSEQQQKLLQSIWRFATVRLHWPSPGAPELSASDEMLAELPAEFARVVEYRRGWSPPGIALTVAGVAVCDRSHPVLQAFLDFVATGPSVWCPVDLPMETLAEDESERILELAEHVTKQRLNPEYRPSFTSLMEAMDRVERPLDPTLYGICDKHRKAAQATKMLMCLLEVETAGWAVIDTVNEGFEIIDQAFYRCFNGVTDLDDYWERRFKPWTVRSLAEATRERVSLHPDTYNRARIFKAQPELFDGVLLESLYAEANGNCNTFVPCPPPDCEIKTSAVTAALGRLESRDLVIRPTLDPAPDLPTVALTRAGVQRVRASHEEWNNLALRRRQARDALLSWLYDQQNHPQHYVHVERFLGDSRGVVNGQFFSLTDVRGAAGYLRDKQLIRGTTVDLTNAPAMARITSQGIDCVEDGGSVSEYLKKQPAVGGVGYTFNAPITAANFAAGDHAQQVANSQGLNGSEIRNLMQTITEALPALQLQPAFADEVTVITAEIVTDADGRVRDQEKLRRGLERLRNLLATSGKTALTAAVTAMIDAAFTKLGLPPGATG